VDLAHTVADDTNSGPELDRPPLSAAGAAPQSASQTGGRDRFVVVVHVIVSDGRRLAMLRRANTGFMDGYYALPGGHQELG
jgi:hypothetical protein